MVLRILTWNINGLKAVIKNRQTTAKGLLDSLSADIICFQEVKTTKDQLEEYTAIVDGYTSYFSFCKTRQGYSGVVTYCRSEFTPTAAEEGITGRYHDDKLSTIGCPIPDITNDEAESLDNEGRGIATEHLQANGRLLVIINIYCPRVDSDNPERLPYKLNFIKTLHRRCLLLQDSGKDVVVCGDINCAMDVIDSASMEDMPTFTKEPDTRQLLSTIISKTPPTSNDMLLDSYRYMNPEVRGAYTCWCTVTSSRTLNYGQRIDYILLSRQLSQFLGCSEVLQEELGSDHCPVRTTLSIDITASTQLPGLCSVNFAKFAGRQSNLLSFFVKKESSRASRKSNNHESQQELVKEKQSVEQQETVNVSKKLSSEWKHVFKSPPKAPVCTGHREPAVLRVVKKPGPNKNRKFYVCNRPDGSKNDPNGRCNFFQWSK